MEGKSFWRKGLRMSKLPLNQFFEPQHRLGAPKKPNLTKTWFFTPKVLYFGVCQVKIATQTIQEKQKSHPQTNY